MTPPTILPFLKRIAPWIVGGLVWLAFPVLSIDFRDGWTYACIGNQMREAKSLWGIVLHEQVLHGTVFHRPAWAYALWASFLANSPLYWLWLEVLIFGGTAAWLLWDIGNTLELSKPRRFFLLLLVGWGIFPMQWMRPQVVLIVAIIGTWGWILKRLRRQTPSLWLLGIFSWIASNFHGGTVLIGLSLWIGGLVGRAPVKEWGKWMLVWFVSSSIHPYIYRFEPWYTTLTFGLHPPAVTEWQALIHRIEGVGSMVVGIISLGLYGWASFRLWRRREASFLIVMTGLMFVLAWFRASRFITWALLGDSMLISWALPSMGRWGRWWAYVTAGVLALEGARRFPWVEDRVQIERLKEIPPPQEITWGMGRTVHVLCWAWPRTPLFHTGMDALHPSLQEALRGGARWAVTHEVENPEARYILPSVGAHMSVENPPYILWKIPSSTVFSDRPDDRVR